MGLKWLLSSCNNAGLIALLTDFGPTHYAGVIKGVIASIAPEARVVDISHAVSNHAVREGAWVLKASYRYFPPGTVFLAVVDPGVGSSRLPLLIATQRYFFVGPDNGLLYPAASEDGVLGTYALHRPLNASPTFEGRDVFAPTAAHLCRHRAPASLGSPCASVLKLDFFLHGRRGEVVLVDHFGNVVTNIPPVCGKEQYTLVYNGLSETIPFYRTYTKGHPGELMVATGSAGTLEIAIPTGRASERLGLFPGDHLELS